MHAVNRVLEACRRLDMTSFIFVADVQEASLFAQRGATGFIIGSDQSMMRTAAQDVQARFQAQIVGRRSEGA